MEFCPRCGFSHYVYGQGCSNPQCTWRRSGMIKTETKIESKTPFEYALAEIAKRDVETLVVKDAEYGSSWKKRGGIGAFMMLARKWDRLENQVTRGRLSNVSEYDIFAQIETERHGAGGIVGESLLETIRDLRRYLLLVESEIELRKQVDRGGTIPATLQTNYLANPLPCKPAVSSEVSGDLT